MAKTQFGDESISTTPEQETQTTQFGDPVAVLDAPIQPTGTTEEAFLKAGETWDMSVAQEVPLESTKQQFADVKEVGEKYKTTQPWRGTFVGGQFVPLSGADRIPGVPVPSIMTLAEVPKGVVRSLERDFAGGAGTMFDWFGQLIQEGGAALQKWTEIGSKDKGQIYNPVAESIIAVGEGISSIGTESREAWAVSASTGWEAFDTTLKETDPISYGAGKISEGLASSALSVTAAYLSGGATAPSVALNAGFQVNRGLVALSAFSAAGSFEHAQGTGENFLWSTAHGMADGMVEYGMETSFLKNVNAGSRVGVGAKEATEELFTGMIQNTRAGILENTNKGMGAYEATKKATLDALKQAPWEMAAGFIGGYGIAAGSDLVSLIDKGNAIPLGVAEGATVSKQVEEPVIIAPTEEQAAQDAISPAKQTKIINQTAKTGIEAVQKQAFTGEVDLMTADVEANKIEDKRVKELSKVEQPPKKGTVKESVVQPIPEAIDILGGPDPQIQVQRALKEAIAVQPITKAEQKAARSQRVGAAAGALKSDVKKGTPTEEAIFKSSGLLKGPLTEYEQRFTSIEDTIQPEAKEAMFAKINEHPDLRYFEVLNTATSFKKLLAGTALTDGDVTNIERVFGKAFVDITKERQTVSSLYDRAIALWKAGLLTGLKTQGLNVVSNFTHAATETAKDVPAAAFDSVASLFTGERTLAITTRGTAKGAKEGVRKGWRYLATGHDERDVGTKLDFRKVNFGTSKFAKGLQVYEETIFHLLGSADQPFYYGAKARSIFSQAIAQGKTKGLKGKELDAFVDKKIKAPTDTMLEFAAYDAEVAVFQNRTLFGDIARGIQKLPGGEIVVPFGRTPAAVATQIINYTPVGVIAETAKQIGNRKLSQRKLSQAVGRSVAGTGALVIGRLLLKAGMMTLDRPRTERERKLWELEGRKPNSVLVDGKWRSVQVLGPGGSVLIVGGHFQDQLEKTGSPTEALVQAVTGGAKSFSEQTFVKGMNMASQALTDPERSFENWFSSMAGSVVPTIVADIARAQDDIERRTEGPLQRFQSRIPGFREDLPPRIDVFGQDLPRYGGNVLEVMIDPSRPAIIRNDVVVTELRRLAGNDIKVTPTLLGDKQGFSVLTTEENTQLWRRQGELTYKVLLAWVDTDAYRSIDNDFVKGKTIDQLVSKTKSAAKAEMVAIKLAQGKGIVELAESGLMTVEGLEALKFFGKGAVK